MSTSDNVFGIAGGVLNMMQASDRLGIQTKNAVKNIDRLEKIYSSNKKELERAYIANWYNRNYMYSKQRDSIIEKYKNTEDNFIAQLAQINSVNNVTGGSFQNDYKNYLDFSEEEDVKNMSTNRISKELEISSEIGVTENQMAQGIANQIRSINDNLKNSEYNAKSTMLSGVLAIGAGLGEIVIDTNDREKAGYTSSGLDGLNPEQVKSYLQSKPKEQWDMIVSSNDRLGNARYRTILERSIDGLKSGFSVSSGVINDVGGRINDAIGEEVNIFRNWRLENE